MSVTTEPVVAPLVAPPEPAVVAPETRRLQRPDLDRHGGWLLKRLSAAYPHIPEQRIGGWLLGLIFNNEVMFLYQPNAVALAQVERGHALAPLPVVRERFVFARDPEKHAEEASFMYAEMDKWAKSLGCEVMLVNQGLTDVPVEMIRNRLSRRRVFVREEMFVKVTEKG